MDPFRTPDAQSITSTSRVTGIEKLGDTDTLVWEGERLIVRSPRPMPDWRVGKNRRTAVHFRGVRYAVVGTREEREQFEYVLDPWPEGVHDHPSQDIHYGEHYVRGREQDAGRLALVRGEAFALLPLWPLLGWLPSPLKRVLNERFGFSPLASTRFSVGVELVLLPICLVAFILPSIGMTALVMAAVLVVDLFFRVSILVDDEYPPFGFFEWVLHPGLSTLLRRGWDSARTARRRRRR